MDKRFFYIIAVMTALAVSIGAYAFVVGPQSIFTPAQARSLTMPANPHILYLALQGSTRGLVNDKVMQAHGATPVRDWQSARSAANTRPLDAILIDASLFNTMAPSDVDWLRSQFHDGVTITGLGVDDDQFARLLGLQTLRAPTEANIPIGPTGYRLVVGLALGTPEDLKTLERTDWINRVIRGEQRDVTDPSTRIKYPMVNSFSKSRGQLNSEQEFELLFLGIRSSIEGTYNMRSEWQQSMKNFKEK